MAFFKLNESDDPILLDKEWSYNLYQKIKKIDHMNSYNWAEEKIEIYSATVWSLG